MHPLPGCAVCPLSLSLYSAVSLSPLYTLSSLKDNAFTSDCCEDLAFALKENQSLLSLDLGKNKVLDSGLSYLCQAFEDPHCRMQKLL